MTKTEEFDLVAPVAIYHHADVEFKSAAKSALLKGKRLGVFPKGVKLDDMKVGERYNELFKSIVQEARPHWEAFFDRWGAQGFRNEDGIVFSGDDMGFFPWFQTAELLLERIGDES